MEAEEASRAAISRMRRTALMNYMAPTSKGGQDGFKRMQACRRALDAIDRQGWQRSFHQRMFHDWFIRACARIFWKTEPLGSFAKNHQRILELNGWDHLSQEVLVSTPRRCLFFLVQAGLGPQGKGGTGSRAYRRQYSPNSRWGRREMKQGGQGGGMGCPSVSSGTSIVRALPGDAREFQQANARFFFSLGAGSARPSRSACSPRPCCTAARTWRCPSTARASASRRSSCATSRSSSRSSTWSSGRPACERCG